MTSIIVKRSHALSSRVLARAHHVRDHPLVLQNRALFPPISSELSDGTVKLHGFNLATTIRVEEPWPVGRRI